jgi:hypothetical protein
MLRASCIALFLLFSAATVQAAEFNNVVSLGDSLLDQLFDLRGPLVSEHLADRLDAPLMELARAGSTSAGLIRQGQHTQAAAEFGTGDLATLWIGGNDFFLSMANPFGVGIGNYRFMDRLEGNVDTILDTLRGAGMEVLVFNLPDMAAVPFTDTLTFFDFQLENISDATLEWNDRLADLATEHGAHLVDVYSYFEEVSAHPENFTIQGHELVFDEFGCEYCVFAEPIHPSALAQGLIANLAIDVLNEAFPEGPQLAPLTEAELAELAGENPIGTLLSRWQAAFGLGNSGDLDGDGDSDGRDFLGWQRQPLRSRTATVTAVPEPNTAVAGLVLAGSLSALRRRS